MLQAGLTPAIFYNIALNATRFSLFRLASSNDHVSLGPVGSGLFAGGVAGFLSSPLARLRTLLQAGRPSSESLRALACRPFAGAPVWALRNAGHTAAIFSLYEASYQKLLSSGGAPSSLTHLASALFAASVSCFVMNPLDVLSTRIFTANPAHTARPSLSAVPTFVRTAYRGLGANLLRTVPHTVLTFVFVESLRSHTLSSGGTVIAVADGGRGMRSAAVRRPRQTTSSTTAVA